MGSIRQSRASSRYQDGEGVSKAKPNTFLYISAKKPHVRFFDYRWDICSPRVCIVCLAPSVSRKYLLYPDGQALKYLQFVDPKSFAVLGANGSFRTSSFNQFFNPTSTNPPFFQIFDEAFLDILGPNPSIQEVASNATFAFAHEGPIYNPPTDEVFFASSDGGPLGNSDLNHNNQVSKISMAAVEVALASGHTPVNVPFTPVSSRTTRSYEKPLK